MPELVYLKVIAFLSFFTTALAGIVWRNLNAKIDANTLKIQQLPHVILLQDMAQIKTDIEWIKKSIMKL